MGHVLYINVMGPRVLYQRYGTYVLYQRLWDHVFYMTVMGPRVLYQRYEKRYMALYLEGMNYIFCT